MSPRPESRSIDYQLPAGEYEIIAYAPGYETTTPAVLPAPGRLTIELEPDTTIDIIARHSMANIIIVLTDEWTNPETGQAHKAGAVAAVPGYFTRLEEHYGILGKYRCPAPWENVTVGDTAPVNQPPSPEDPPAAVEPKPTPQPRREAATTPSTAPAGG